MSAQSIGSPLPEADRDRWLVWAPLAVGISVLLLPTYVRLHQGAWNQEAYEHGPIIVAIFWFLVWRSRNKLLSLRARPRPWAGWPLIVGGLFCYFIGRSQDLPLFEVGAQLPLFAGLLLALFGWPALRILWFPLLFLAFLVPLPGFVIVGITGELKQHVSALAETLLFQAGYPIARDGVVITVGQYRMLVADACSGLNSIYSLTALGLLYMHLVNRPGWLRNGVLLLSILPLAFLANVVRVVILILLTYHFGDAAGQGFLHGSSGVVLFLVALLGLFVVDGLIGWASRAERPRSRESKHAV